MSIEIPAAEVLALIEDAAAAEEVFSLDELEEHARALEAELDGAT